jgi:hypothetical protein
MFFNKLVLHSWLKLYLNLPKKGDGFLLQLLRIPDIAESDLVIGVRARILSELLNGAFNYPMTVNNWKRHTLLISSALIASSPRTAYSKATIRGLTVCTVMTFFSSICTIVFGMRFPFKCHSTGRYAMPGKGAGGSL